MALLREYKHDVPKRLKQGFLNGDLGPPLGATQRFFGGHKQRPSLDTFAEAFAGITKPVVTVLSIRQLNLNFFIITW